MYIGSLTLYAFNLHNCICLLYLNKAGEIFLNSEKENSNNQKLN